MSRALCISVTLLDPHFHGRADRSAPEWPPSPLRLFQALIAGACAGGTRFSIEAADAFRWLEKQAAPEIIAPRVGLTNGHKLFVPNNDGDKEPDRQKRLTEKPVRPHRLNDEGPLHYVWRIDDAEWSTAEAHATALCRQARKLHTLGWGIDMAFADGRVLTGDERAGLQGERWNPWPQPSVNARRVPIERTFDDLETVHQSFLASIDPARNLYRPSLKPRVFAKVSYLPANSVPPRLYAAFSLEFTDGDGRRAFPQAKAAHVAAMLRSRACAASRDDSHWNGIDTATYVAGHAGGEEKSPARFSYLPLPSVGHHHADGMIRRVLIAQQYGEAEDHSRWAASRLDHTALIEEKTQKPRAVLATIREDDSVVPRYVGLAAAWFSVTPVILPGMDDQKHAKALKLLNKAIVQAGIDPAGIAELTIQRAPLWQGSLHPRQFVVPDYLANLPRWNVKLRFHQPISGPLTIGAGRHVGLGLFAFL